MKHLIRWRFSIALALAVALVMSMGASAFAASVVPVLDEEWKSGDAWTEVTFVCKDATWAIKVDEWSETEDMDGDYTADAVEGDKGDATITIYDSTSTSFSWRSDFPVCVVIIKAGKAANIYYYDGAYGDTNLVAPGDKDISHVSFGGGDGDDNGDLYYALSGTKWYDRDKDGVWDVDEPGLEDWKVSLFEWAVVDVVDDQEVYDWAWVADDYTNADGGYTFADLEPGTYKVVEGQDADVSGWVQTFPADPNYYEVTIADTDVADLDFGNVCETTSTGGFTLGYWSNKNGAASLAAYNAAEGSGAWQSFLSEYDLVNKAGDDFDPTTHAAFKTWLLKADASNMSYMLSVQMAATLLNIEVKGAEYAGYGVIDMDGTWISIADLIIKANDFLSANDVTVEAGAARDEAEFYKNIFDDLNNNKQTLIPYDPCSVPVNWR